MKIRTYVDADCAGNFSTRRSLTGILIFLNNLLIICFLKRQNMVESSSFRSEFVALRITKEMRVFEIIIDSPVYEFCGNEYVTKNVTLPNLALNKRKNVIYYHRFHGT